MKSTATVVALLTLAFFWNTERTRAQDSSNASVKPVLTVKIAGVNSTFLWIPPGEFVMGIGSDGADVQAGSFGEDQHNVRITRGFWLAETETTVELWGAVMKTYPGKNRVFFKREMLPVENVSWNDCQEFIERIQRYAPRGMRFKLPSEAHWEYACRAGTTTSFSWGDEWDDRKASLGSVKPVGSFSYVNRFGLKDMHDNVGEWCEDWFANYDRRDTVDPNGPDDGSARVCRGGGDIFCSPDNVRSGSRLRFVPTHKSEVVGFRLELTDVPAE